MDSPKILLIADDLNILRTLRRNLVDRGYDVSIALDDREALDMLAKVNPDLFILNLEFASTGINGLIICEQLRKLSRCPIMVLTTVGAENDKIRALDIGADDCLDMPFNIDVFLARVRAALRRWFDYSTGILRKGDLVICGELLMNNDTREMWVNGIQVKLTRTEFDMLKYLVDHSGKVVTHKELLKGVWGVDYGVQKEYLRVYISQLRKKIETNPMNPRYILTEPGIGYRFRSEFSD